MDELEQTKKETFNILPTTLTTMAPTSALSDILLTFLCSQVSSLEPSLPLFTSALANA